VNVLAEIVGDSASIQRLRKQLEQIMTRAATAPRPPAMLLRGETGTGKGLVARTMHRAGPRAGAPFVDINCAAIPDNLLEAELFGYERGAFTDARQAKPGLFQLAHRGMLFLDEIGMLSPALQAKLLKVLEDGVVRRLGGTRPEPVDVWIVSATNEDLADAMRARRFREDLYHRLALLSLELPPLRERGDDILLLAERFLARACADYGLSTKTFARDARLALTAYGWPGNVRELGNIIERVALLADESVVTAAMLALPETAPVEDPPDTEPAPSRSSRNQMREHLLDMLTETGWNISQTAVRLGVARNTVLARITRFGLNRSAATPRAASPVRATSARDAPAAAPIEVAVPRVTTSRPTWEPRRVALLRVDVAASGRLDELIAKVETFGGNVVELGRSAFVAAFGLEGVEDAPARAALAALAILKASERAKSDGGGPRAKIVVHVAQVLVSQHQGAVTIDLESKRVAWTTIEALAGLDQLDTVVVSETSAPFLERRFELTPAMPSEASAPFRCLTRREPTGFGLGSRPLSRFVGRDGEIRRVTDRLAEAARGQGQVIGIVGEPGVGKSRFMYELTRLDAMQGWRVLGGRGVSHGSTTPLLAVGDLLRRYFAIEDADEPEVIREKVTETILSRHEALKSFLTPLFSLLDLAVDDQSWNNLDPPQRRQRIQDAVKRLLLNESRIQPLLLLIEDLHWIDAETQAALDGLVDGLPTARLLLLVNYRPEYQHRWGSKTYYSQLWLDALAPERAGDLVSALLGDDPTLAPLTRLLVERGNPFFIEEAVETLVETGALQGTRGTYRLTQRIDAIDIPATVQMSLAARIERLSTDDKQLLQTASVIGKDVPIELLHVVAQMPEGDLQRGLAHLQAAEFLYETRFLPDAEYTFKHALTHEVTYGTLLEERRKELHARIVGAIERAHPDRLTEHVERLAHHAVRGEVWEQAVTYLRQAGAKARARSANREAVSRFEQALDALQHLPESRARTEQAIDLHLDASGALTAMGGWAKATDHVRKAEALAEALGDERRLGWALMILANLAWNSGDSDRGLELGQRALTIAMGLNDVSLQTSVNYHLGVIGQARGSYRESAEVLSRVAEALQGDRRYERLGTAIPASVGPRARLAWCLAELGEFAGAMARGEEAVRIAHEVDDFNSLVGACRSLGFVCLRRGAIPQAIPPLERAVELCRAQVRVLFDITAAHLGYAYALSGRLPEGVILMEEAVADPSATGTGHHPLLLSYLGEAYLLAGRRDDACAVARRAFDLAHRQKERGNEAWVLRLLGEIAAQADPLDLEAADAHYRQALARADELGMRPLVAHCHRGLGKLHRRAGDDTKAPEHLTTAATMYREMGMTFWLEKAEAEMSGLA
jgi:transcriptional regulator with AAA-type ATPase domain/tetratricopeptide (TPR) repeat protein